ncbi:MAG TPA: DUF2510 domain-containing protein [Actinomycetes bacterium]|nr:DUF2510 domain-containing protein [Actinomycetes bacterium]
MTDGSPTMQPGWYPDPSLPGQLRYWSGTQWTQDVQAAPPPPGDLVRPWWQQWWAIILTLLVCFPLGLIGVWQRKGTSAGVKIAVSLVALLLYSGALVARSRG